jgi:hypothetical protein
MGVILVTIGKWAASLLLPIGAFFGLSWAMTPAADMSMTYLLMGILAVIAVGLVVIAYKIGR